MTTPARPLRALPVIQKWDCHQCGNCCTDYLVQVSDAEKRRIEEQGWDQLDEFRDQSLFVRHSPWWRFWRKKYRLRTVNDRCIFLANDGLCKIHGKFGLEAKPFACRLYPFILVQVGDHWRVSMRFACPSATANKGRGLAEQKQDITGFAHEMEHWDEPEEKESTPSRRTRERVPILQGKTATSWADLEVFLEGLLQIVRDRSDPFPRRMMRMLELARTCKQATFDKVTGKKLKEFLALIGESTRAEVPRDLTKLAPPGWIGRILFRTTLAVFLRKDSGVRRGVAARSRLALMGAMMKMVSGRGALPRLQAGLPTVPMSQFEEPLGPLEPDAVEALERYYAVKLESCQFFGPTNNNLGLWDGLAFLILTFPCITWLARGYRQEGLTQTAAVHKAITVIDENYGYNPLLGHARQKLATRILFSQKELDRLVAWYGR